MNAFASQALPSRPVGLAQGALGVLQARWLDRRLWHTPLITSTFIAKLAIPPFGAVGLSVAIPVIAAATALGAASGRLVVDTPRLLAYLLVMALLSGLQLLIDGPFSVSSLLLLLTLHLPYVFQLQRVPDYAQVVAYFQALCVVIAGLGVVQYVIQFFIGPAFAFPIENFFPAEFRVDAFNMQGYLAYGSETYRANGVFMLEPSFFSQLLAIAIVVEAVSRRRAWVVALMLLSMLLSYSGTGIALLLVCLLVVSVRQRRWVPLGALVAAAAVLVAVAGMVEDVPYVSVFLSRAGEFSAEGSSGFARFVGGFFMFDQFLWSDPWRAVAGYGAGSFQRYSERAHYPASGMALFKMVFEFGVLGAAAYFAFLYGCLWRSGAPAAIRLAVGLSFLLNGNYIPFAHGLALTLLVWPAPHRPKEPHAPRPS